MAEGFPPDYFEIVRRHEASTRGYMLAMSGECVDIREWELGTRARHVAMLDIEELPTFTPGGSWHLAVLACAPAEVARVTEWLAGRPREDVERVTFYVLSGLDVDTLFAKWIALGLPDPNVSEFDGHPRFAQRYGRDLNDVVYRDARAGLAGGTSPMQVSLLAKVHTGGSPALALEALAQILPRSTVPQIAVISSPAGRRLEAAVATARASDAESLAKRLLAARDFRLPRNAVDAGGRVKFELNTRSPPGARSGVTIEVTIRFLPKGPAPGRLGRGRRWAWRTIRTTPDNAARAALRRRFGVSFD